MNATAYHYYGDSRTLEVLHGSRPAVLLLGSYQGCSNFGDILQLKGAIRWHQLNTELEPVILVNAYSLSSPDYIERLRRWFGTSAVLLWSEERLDGSPHGVSLIEEPPVVPHLHLYGGGFLNSYWGERMLAVTEATHDAFGVGHYVISGQQVQPEFRPRLTQHLERYRPVLAGGRDRASADVLAACGVQARYSFDDAAESVQELAKKARIHSGSDSGLAVHLNASNYTAADAHSSEARIRQLICGLDSVTEHLRQVTGKPSPEVTLLNVCSDGRVNDIKDSLSVLLELEDRFPYSSFQLIDMSKAALEYGLSDLAVSPLEIRAQLALVCSYHTAMFCNMAGVPVFLETSNQYYEQKAAGLGFNGDLQKFLKKPTLVSFASHLEARAAWLAELKEAYARPVSLPPRKHHTAPEAGSAKPWPFRNSHWGELRQINESCEAQRVHIEELTQARDRFWTELQRMREATEQQRAYIEELSSARDQLWSELCDNRSKMAELDKIKSALQAAEHGNRHWGLKIAALRAEMEYLREEFGSARWSMEQELNAARSALGSTRTELENAQHILRNTQAELDRLHEALWRIERTLTWRIRKFGGRMLRGLGIRK